MKESSRKLEKYAYQIRKKQRENIRGQLRSKLLNAIRNGEQSQVLEELSELAFLNSLPNVGIRLIDKIHYLLASIVLQYGMQISKHEHLNKGSNIIQYMLISPNSESFYLHILNSDKTSETCCVSMIQFIALLKKLPKVLCKFVNNLDLNLVKIKLLSTKTVRSYQDIQEYQSVLSKLEQCRIVKEIITFCNIYIDEYSKMLEDIEIHFINLDVIEIMTDCLIEGTYFRPRQLIYQSKSQEPEIQNLVSSINEEMNTIRSTINLKICHALIPVISNFNCEINSVKLFTNYIYIMGNIFINLNSYNFLGQNYQYQRFHQVIIQQIDNCIEKLLRIVSLEEGINQFANDVPAHLELCSLAVWFIRNELLIIEGLFNLHKEVTAENVEISEIANKFWMKIVFNIFKVLESLFTSNKIENNQASSKQYVDIILQSISLIQVIDFDFGLTEQNMADAVSHMVWFRERVDYKDDHQRQIYAKVYDFYFNLISSDRKEKSWMNNIYNEAVNICNGTIMCPNGLKFCSKIIDPNSRIDKAYKLNLFVLICNNIDKIIRLVNPNGKYDEKLGLLALLHSSMRQNQFVAYASEMSFELLGLDKVQPILEISRAIWEEDRNNEDIISTLQMIAELANRQQYTGHLKMLITSQGYSQNLENLSSYVNEDINRLVYEIYELLDIN